MIGIVQKYAYTIMGIQHHVACFLLQLPSSAAKVAGYMDAGSN